MDDLETLGMIEPDQRPDIAGTTQDLCLNSTECNGSFIDYYRSFPSFLIPLHSSGFSRHFSIIFTPRPF